LLISGYPGIYTVSLTAILLHLTLLTFFNAY
jgi:hypothetical protein